VRKVSTSCLSLFVRPERPVRPRGNQINEYEEADFAAIALAIRTMTPTEMDIETRRDEQAEMVAHFVYIDELLADAPNAPINYIRGDHQAATVRIISQSQGEIECLIKDNGHLDTHFDLDMIYGSADFDVVETVPALCADQLARAEDIEDRYSSYLDDSDISGEYRERAQGQL
jgi:hypothetical protein